jgi:membrane protease YdiL (CAAX protease family)
MNEFDPNQTPQVPAPGGEPASEGQEPQPAVEAVPPLPEDLRAPWGWGDLVVFFFFGIGGAILSAQVAAVAILVLMGVSPASYQKNPTALAAHATLAQALWSLVMMLFLFALIRVRFDKPFWREIGWRDLRLEGVSHASGYLLCLLSGGALAILIQLASGFVSTDRKLPIQELFQTRESVLFVAATAILVAPLVEETVFRGFLYPVLARSWGVGAGVIVTGTLFGLVHSMQLSGGYGQIGLLMVVGIVLTYVRARTGTVVASYLLHLGYNTLLFVAFYFATGGFRNLPKLS